MCTSSKAQEKMATPAMITTPSSVAEERRSININNLVCNGKLKGKLTLFLSPHM
jgi:hypothetical protein